mmetsp:Transcript_9716/g.17085  ORF Transcript_9716/g.17085 Transcript_9716/m.17085 type:complete len:550 (-) Transcript_9716:312-1961(-)
MPQAGLADQKQMFRTDGSYDFKRREDWDYRHGYEYMSGMLGLDEEKAEKKRKKKLGTTDLPAPPIPKNQAYVEFIEKTALHIHKSSDAKVFERLIADRNKGKEGWAFMEENGDGNDYYVFVRHCLEREVNPRPLAEQARRVKEDRDIKQANANANVFTAKAADAIPQKEAKFKPGELMEVLGLKNKTDYNGQIVRVLKFHPQADRYECVFEGGRYNTIPVKLREENLMYSSVTEKEVKETEIPEGEIPNGTRVIVHGLQSDAAKWMNGQNGIIVQWDKEVERYEVRLDVTTVIKKVKPANIRIELPEGWEEHHDEHLGRNYYIHVKTQKVTWKHPTVANTRARMGKVTEKQDADMEEVEVDKEHTHYEVDDEEEGEGQFNLQELVKKVEEKEELALAAEEKGEEFEDSDDGMHKVTKKRKKKHQKVTVEQIHEKVIDLIDQTMVNRATLKKDYTLLEGFFIAQKDLDPHIEIFEAAMSKGEPPGDHVMRATIEVMLGALTKACVLLPQLRVSKLQIIETNRLVDRLTTLTDPAQLLDDAKWVAGMLKTM